MGTEGSIFICHSPHMYFTLSSIPIHSINVQNVHVMQLILTICLVLSSTYVFKKDYVQQFNFNDFSLLVFSLVLHIKPDSNPCTRKCCMQCIHFNHLPRSLPKRFQPFQSEKLTKDKDKYLFSFRALLKSIDASEMFT